MLNKKELEAVKRSEFKAMVVPIVKDSFNVA